MDSRHQTQVVCGFPALAPASRVLVHRKPPPEVDSSREVCDFHFQIAHLFLEVLRVACSYIGSLLLNWTPLGFRISTCSSLYVGLELELDIFHVASQEQAERHLYPLRSKRTFSVNLPTSSIAASFSTLSFLFSRSCFMTCNLSSCISAIFLLRIT